MTTPTILNNAPTPTPAPTATPEATPKINTDAPPSGEVIPPTDAPKDAPKADDGAKPAPPVVPEKYEFSMPEGHKLAEPIYAKFSETAKTLGLSQENAQKLVDIAIENSKLHAEETAKAWDKQREDWKTSLKDDKEFGGDKFNETVERANRAFKNFASPELTKFLMDSGFGDNADLIKMFAKIDAKIGDDKILDGAGASKVDTRSAAEVLYPTTK